jgi:hypothetical protein
MQRRVDEGRRTTPGSSEREGPSFILRRWFGGASSSRMHTRTFHSHPHYVPVLPRVWVAERNTVSTAQITSCRPCPNNSSNSRFFKPFFVKMATNIWSYGQRCRGLVTSTNFIGPISANSWGRYGQRFHPLIFNGTRLACGTKCETLDFYPSPPCP